MTWKTGALYRAVFAAMHDIVLEFFPEDVIADFGRRPSLLFTKYSAVSQSPVAGFTTSRLCWSSWTSLPERRLPEPRRHQGHYSLHLACCVCRCCMPPPTSRLVCKRFVQSLQWHANVSAASGRWSSIFRSWFSRPAFSGLAFSTPDIWSCIFSPAFTVL